MSRKVALIVEDDPTTREVVKEFLIVNGCEVFEAPDAASGLELFEKERPNIVLLDIELPDRDGIEVCAAMRRHALGGETAVYMLTGHEDLDRVQRAGEAGANDYLTKPICWDRLREFVVEAESLARRVHVVTAQISPRNATRVVLEVFQFLRDADAYSRQLPFELDARVDSLEVRAPADVPEYVA